MEEKEEGGDQEQEEGGDDDEVEQINDIIVEKATKIKQLVTDKRLGLPQAYSDRIKNMADAIISQHSDTEVIYKKVYRRRDKPPQPPEKLASNIIAIAERSEGILKIVSSARSEESVPEPGTEATEHLEKMVKKLHCRYRQLKRLAEEIIAKRWKLKNLLLGKEGKTVKNEGSTAKEAAAIRKKIRRRKLKEKCGHGKKSKKRQIDDKDLVMIYNNPMAKLKNIAKSYGGPETWKEDDPLVKVLNKVGVDIVEKCMNREDDTEDKPKKRKRRQQNQPGPVSLGKRNGVFPSRLQPDMTAHFGKSAVTIFMSNYSRMAVAPSETTNLGVEHSIRMLNVDKAKLANNFVDMWKRRSYSVGIFLIILTALLHCSYLCGPRMGDNYVTYPMVESLSGWPFLTPVGIYGLIFVGYLFGGMAVVKTAAATTHNLTVKDYFKARKKKFLIWYLLVIYFFVVWLVRCILWYNKIEKTEQEIRAIFKTEFYYNQLPSRMLYSQFLFSCCGANGPGDYPEAKTIGWPKSCYVRVNSYEEYYVEPKPIEFGCSSIVYVYSIIGLSVICSLCLIILILAILQPVYLYVYELFICMRSKEPEPWLEYSDI